MMQQIEQYCKTKSYEDFEKIGPSAVFFVDWREYDDAIVGYCENIIKSNQLSAQLLEDDVLFIDYKGKHYRQQTTKSRDLTIRLLNEILQPDYEIRFCIVTFPSDTLGFILLSAEQWNLLAQHIPPATLDLLFEPIHSQSKMFDRSFDIEDYQHINTFSEE